MAKYHIAGVVAGGAAVEGLAAAPHTDTSSSAGLLRQLLRILDVLNKNFDSREGGMCRLSY